MLQVTLLFIKQILAFGGIRVSQLPHRYYQALLTAFHDMFDHQVVMIEPMIKLIKAVPGRLILDDTTNPKYGLKQWARKMKIVGSSGYAHGYKILLFLWDCPYGRIPIGFALWHKETKPINELVLIGLGSTHKSLWPETGSGARGWWIFNR